MRNQLTLLAVLLVAVAGLAPAAGALLTPPALLDCVEGLALVSPRCPAWEARLDHAKGEDEGIAIAVSPDGETAYTAGGRHGEGAAYLDFDALLLARSVGDGALLWQQTFASPLDGADRFFDVAVDAAGGRVYAAGQVQDGSTNRWHHDVLVAAVDALTGEHVWVAQFDEGMTEMARAVAVSPDGATVYAAGSISSSWTHSRAFVMALDAATGELAWRDIFDVGYGGYNYANALDVSDDGERVVIAGTVTGLTSQDYVTAAYDAATGELAWRERYNGAGQQRDGAHALAIDGDRVFVTGSSVGTSDTWGDITTVGYDLATGELAWQARHNGPGNHYDGADAIAVSQGRVFVAGVARGAGQLIQPVTLAYDAASGASLWTAVYQPFLAGPVTGGLSALAVNEETARVYAVGQQRGRDGSPDPIVAAYSVASGQLEWFGKYEGDGGTYESAEDVAIAPGSGRVLTTGIVGAGWASIASDDGPSANDHPTYPNEPHGDVLNLAFDG